MGPYKPLRTWVDDHPLYGNIWTLDDVLPFGLEDSHANLSDAQGQQSQYRLTNFWCQKPRVVCLTFMGERNKLLYYTKS